MSKRDSLFAYYNNNGLLFVEMPFLEENWLLFLAYKPKIEIFIDSSLEINRFHPMLVPLINDVLNRTRHPLTNLNPNDPNDINLFKLYSFINNIK